MGGNRALQRKVNRAKNREALANTNPDNVELRQRVDFYHAAQNAKREARQTEYPGLGKRKISLQKALEEEAVARKAVDAAESLLSGREERLKQAKGQGELKAVKDSIVVCKKKLDAANAILQDAEAKVAKRRNNVESAKDNAKAETEPVIPKPTEKTPVPDVGGTSQFDPWGELVFNPWVSIETDVGKIPPPLPPHSPSPPPPPQPSIPVGEPVVEPVIPDSAVKQLEPDTGIVQIPCPNQGSAGEAKLLDAQLKFFQSFRYGYEILPTSARGLLCGWYAVIESMKAQYPDIERPTAEQLQELTLTTYLAEFEEFFNLGHTNNYSMDQIAVIFHHWSQTKSINLQLGVFWAEKVLLQIHPREDDPEIELKPLWIHNDNAMDKGIGHYSGMKAALSPAAAGSIIVKGEHVASGHADDEVKKEEEKEEEEEKVKEEEREEEEEKENDEYVAQERGSALQKRKYVEKTRPRKKRRGRS